LSSSPRRLSSSWRQLVYESFRALWTAETFAAAYDRGGDDQRRDQRGDVGGNSVRDRVARRMVGAVVAPEVSAATTRRWCDQLARAIGRGGLCAASTLCDLVEAAVDHDRCPDLRPALTREDLLYDLLLGDHQEHAHARAHAHEHARAHAHEHALAHELALVASSGSPHGRWFGQPCVGQYVGERVGGREDVADDLVGGGGYVRCLHVVPVGERRLELRLNGDGDGDGDNLLRLLSVRADADAGAPFLQRLRVGERGDHLLSPRTPCPLVVVVPPATAHAHVHVHVALHGQLEGPYSTPPSSDDMAIMDVAHLLRRALPLVLGLHEPGSFGLTPSFGLALGYADVRDQIDGYEGAHALMCQLRRVVPASLLRSYAYDARGCTTTRHQAERLVDRVCCHHRRRARGGAAPYAFDALIMCSAAEDLRAEVEAAATTAMDTWSCGGVPRIWLAHEPPPAPPPPVPAARAGPLLTTAESCAWLRRTRRRRAAAWAAESAQRAAAAARTTCARACAALAGRGAARHAAHVARRVHVASVGAFALAVARAIDRIEAEAAAASPPSSPPRSHRTPPPLLPSPRSLAAT
jgi:hypothetical protein